MHLTRGADQSAETFARAAGPAPGFEREPMRAGATGLRQALDEHIANARRGPAWGRLIVKYFGAQALTVLGRAR